MGVGVDHQHATNDFCIAPRLAESGAYSREILLQEPSAQVCEYARRSLPYGPAFYVKAFSHNCRTKTGVLDGANGVKTGEKWAQVPQYGSKVQVKGTTWCIHVVEGAKLGQRAQN